MTIKTRETLKAVKAWFEYDGSREEIYTRVCTTLAEEDCATNRHIEELAYVTKLMTELSSPTSYERWLIVGGFDAIKNALRAMTRA